jgi:hypothetical protein
MGVLVKVNHIGEDVFSRQRQTRMVMMMDFWFVSALRAGAS